MRDDQHRFLALMGELPARLTSEQAAWVLGLQAHDIPTLIAANLLQPLGKPMSNSVKYFARVEVVKHANDVRWLGKATNAISQFWKHKNGRKKDSPTALATAAR